MKARSRSKGKGRFVLGGHSIATQLVPGKAPIDISRFIPVVTAGARGAGQVRLIRRADLVPDSPVGAPAANTVHFGDVLVDVFTPMYGSYYPLGKPAFVFYEGRVYQILNSVWNLVVQPGDQHEQVLNFKIERNIQANYLKVLIGRTLDAAGNGAILSVRIDGTQFNLDLKTQSYQYFDLVLPGDGSVPRDVRFMLNIAVNNLRTSVCPIFQVELYNTIRVYPDPTVFA